MKAVKAAVTAALFLSAAAHAEVKTVSFVCGDHIVQVSVKDSQIERASIDDKKAIYADVMHTAKNGAMITMLPIIMQSNPQQSESTGYLLTIKGSATTLTPFRSSAAKGMNATGITTACNNA